MNSGWLGVGADGFRNGSYCGTTGTFYNNVTYPAWSVGSKLCTNPAGNQNFNTLAYGAVWTYISPNWKYVGVGTVSSPSQTY
jgi:hypothetical protein